MPNNKGGVPMYNENPQYSATISSQLPQGSPASFGTQVAKEMAGMGDAIGKWGTNLVEHALKMQERDDNAFILEKDNEMRAAMTDLLYNPQNGLANTKGKNSFGVTQTYDEAVEKLTQDAMSNIGNPALQAKLQEHNMQWVNSLRTAIAKHEGGERFTYYSNQMSASSLHAQNFGLQIGGLEGMQASIAMRAGLRDTGKSLLGWDDIMADNWEREENSKTFSLIAKDFIDRGNIGGLQSLVDAYGDKVTGAALTDAKSKLKVITQQQDAAKLAEQLIAEHPELIDEDGNLDEAKYAELVDQLNGENAADRVEHVWVGGGSFFSDSSVNADIVAGAQKYNVNPAVVAAVASVESNGSHTREDGKITTSSVGALGIMQLMPDTAASLGVDPNDRKQNVEGGAKYLSQLIAKYGFDTDEQKRKVFAAYNAGPGAVDDYGGVPPYKETQNYVNKCMDALAQYEKASAPVDLSDIPMQNFEDTGLAKTNNTLKAQFRSLYDWAVQKFGKKVEISGGWRSEENNRANNGAKNSHHLYGEALDVNVEMLTAEERNEFIAEAQRRGFNKGGDDFYHNKGSGYHVHLVMEDDGSGGAGHYEERRVSGYNPVLNSAMKAYGKRKADMIKGENERQITTWANALFENPNVINARDQSEIDVEMDKMGIPRNKRAKVMARVNYSMSVNNSRVSRERSDESYDRTKKTWREQDASDKLAGWMKNNPNATTQQVLEMGDQLGISNKEYIAIRDSKGGAGAKLKNAYAWAKDPNNEKAFNDTISGLKLNSLQKANIRIYLNNLSEERMGKNEPPLTDEDIIAEVKKKAGKVVINKGTTGIYGGEEITEADLPPGAERTEYGVLLNGYTMAPVRDDNGTIVDWKVMNAD